MLIGIDGNEANISSRVGIGQFAFHLLWGLFRLNGKHRFLIYLKQPPLADLPPTSSNWQYLVFGPSSLWTQFALPLRLFAGPKIDIFYSPNHYLPFFSPCPKVATIHDLGYLQYPDQFTRKDLFQLTRWTENSLRPSQKLIAVSEFTKSEIQRLYHLDPQKITVAPNGVGDPPSISPSLAKNILSSFHLDSQKYFLYLGTLKPNKNIPFLIHAYARLLRSLPTVPKLVIAGKKGWLYHEIFQVAQQEHLSPENLIFTDFVDENQKWTLLHHATCLIIPSLYEGFGIPAIEAMKVGTPVIASHIPPLKEVVGPHGLLIDPCNQDDLIQKMKVILSPATHRRYSLSGPKQAAKYTWNQTAQKVLSALV